MLQLRVLALLTLCLSARAGAQDRTITLAGREVAMWDARGTGGRPAPAVFFSHGLGGCHTGSSFLKRALAARGYWVFAPKHADAGCGSADGAPPARLPTEWSDATYLDRANDILAVHGALQSSRAYARRIDFSRIGYAGHSLGGYTVIGLAGGWSAWGKAPGLRAVLALSPYVQPFLRHSTLSGLSVPIMYQGGTADGDITPFVTRRGGAYDASPAPKYLVVFTGATHASWGDRRKASHDDIVAYSVAFLDRYVRDRPESPTLTTALPGVASLKFEARR